MFDQSSLEDFLLIKYSSADIPIRLSTPHLISLLFFQEVKSKFISRGNKSIARNR